MTKSEREHIERAVALGCALCRHIGYGESPAEYHHRRTGTGAGRKAQHIDGMPLCPQHHRIGSEALHAMGRKSWEAHFGITEIELIEQTQALLYAPNDREQLRRNMVARRKLENMREEEE